MATEKYNGWTNYETWCVALHLDNEQGSYDYWRAIAQEAWEQAVPTNAWTRSEAARFELSDRLKDEHEESKPDVSGVWADMLNAALAEVEWDEIANHYLQDCQDEEDEDEPGEAEKYESAS